jgi:D-alanyl-D-alanine carboxypeptidase
LSGGAAGRADSLSGVQPDFRARLQEMFRHAPPGSSVFSGYRSEALQAQLFANSDRSGRMVARPGHSHHGQGDAADIRGNLQWFREHAGEYGLRFPMPWERWHIQSDPNTKVPAPRGLDADIRQRAHAVHALHGRASVDINLKGFPRGTKTAAKTEGIFNEVRLNRGRAVPIAEG